MSPVRKQVNATMQRIGLWIKPAMLLAARYQTATAALTLIASLLFFFSWSLANLNTHYFSAADLSQGLTLLRVKPNHTPGNPLLSDTYQNMQSWMFFNREQVSRGQIPLWNPYNANGMPHLANYQSAVLSPFSLSYYLFDIKTALLLTPFLALFLHGLFSYLFLRQLRLGFWASLIGAMAFMYSGFMILWLDWQNLTVSSLSLPIGLYCVERIFTRLDPHNAQKSAPVFWSLAGLTAALATGLLGGHPEAFFAAFLLLAAYVAYRLLGMLFDSGFHRAMRRRLSVLSAQISFAGVLALGLAGAQLLPFVEYAANSGIVNHRTPGHQSLELLPFFLFPNLLGTPSGNYRATLSLPFLNYNEVNGFYIGCLMLLMALLALALLRRNRHARFFGGVALVWFAYYFNILGIGEMLRQIPGLSMLPPIRSHIIWLFSAACSAALFVDFLFTPAKAGDRLRTWLLFAIPVMAGALLIGAFILSNQIFVRLAPELAKDAASFFRAVPPHMLSVAITYCAGVSILTVLCLRQREWLQPIAGAALLLLVFWQGGYQFKTHNPITQNELFYSVSPAVADIQRYAGKAHVAIPTADTIPAHANMAFDISLVTAYDALWVARHDRLFHALFSVPEAAFGSPRIIYRMSPLGLQLFGVDTIAAVNTWQNTTIPPADLQQLASADTYSIYRYTGGMSRYYTVDRAQLARTAEQAFEMIFYPAFDPAQSVVIEAAELPNAAPATSPPQAAVQIIDEEAMSIRLKATRATPGYLVLAKTFYPGWKATVNGTPQPVLPANYAFSAVALGAGESEIVVYYDPDSWRYGLLLSGVSLAGCIIALAVWFALRRRAHGITRNEPLETI